MDRFLKQSTAYTLKIGPFIDETDGITPLTALTVSQADVRLSKNGGNMAQKNESTSCSHDEIGWYDCPIDATDTGTLGELTLMVQESGSLPVWHKYMVLPANVYDSLVSGSDKLDANMAEVSGDSNAADTLEGYLDANIFPAGINQIYGDTDAAQNLLAMFLGSFITGEVDDASPSTTDFNGDALLSSTDDFYNDMYLTFTSGTLKGISRRIVDYTGSSRNFVFTGEAWPATPEDDATFIIIARNG